MAERIIDRDVEFYVADLEYRQAVLRRSLPSEEQQAIAIRDASFEVVDALKKLRDLIDEQQRS